jgi:hypothetical protein
LEPIECIFSEWTEWSDVNPTAKPSYYDTYAYDTPDYDYESDYEDATTTSDCTCKQIEVENKTAVNELQFRSRSLIKEGTIGGDFCDESATDVQKCICGNGKYISWKFLKLFADFSILYILFKLQ